MQNRQLIGGALLGAVALTLGAVAIGGRERAPTKPAPVILKQDPAKTSAEAKPEWRAFACTRRGQSVNYFPQAKAEFLSRENNQVRWKVTTPSESRTLTVDPSTVICGYVNS
jgi:hypothetical protein